MMERTESGSRPVALVTGSSRGIGRAIAIALAAAGHAVTVNYFRSPEAAEEVVEAIRAAGGEALAVQGDVAVPADRDRMVDQTLTQWERIDVLINNAGITSPGRRDLLEATESNWDTVFATNLKGPFFLAQRVAREIIALRAAGVVAGGTIVNVSSISAYAVSTDRVDYCIAKSALQMMTWQLACRLAAESIRVYEICPGVIASDMTAPVRDKYDRLIAEGLSPIRRWGTPEDVAKAVVAVVAGLFPFSTGDRINVDGGYHVRRL